MTTLYKRNPNNNKIQVWSIEVHEDGKYRTSEGYQGGKITTSVSKNTTILVIPDNDDKNTSKVKKAMELGLKIIRNTDFISEYINE